MKPEEIKEYRKQKRAKAEMSLDMYVQIAKCTGEDLEVQFRPHKFAAKPAIFTLAMFVTKWIQQDEHVILMFQVGCAKVIIETDNVAEGLEELISLHNITELVMGAAADRHFYKYGSN